MKHDIKTVTNLYRVQNKSKQKEPIRNVNNLEKNKHPAIAKPQSIPQWVCYLHVLPKLDICILSFPQCSKTPINDERDTYSVQ